MTQSNKTKKEPQTKTVKSIQMTLDMSDKETALLQEQLKYLKLPGITENYELTAIKAAHETWSHVHYLTQLVELETSLRQERAIERRVKTARFPILKTLEQFRWNWPKKINQLQVKDLFRLQFMKEHANVILLGGVGLGKTHLATALGHHACLNGKCIRLTFRKFIKSIS